MDPLLIFATTFQTSREETICSWGGWGGCLFHRDVVPSNLEPFQAIFIAGATVPPEYCYFGFVLLHHLLYSFVTLIFFQIRQWRLMSGGRFILRFGGDCERLFGRSLNFFLYWLFINCLLSSVFFQSLRFKSRSEFQHSPVTSTGNISSFHCWCLERRRIGLYLPIIN